MIKVLLLFICFIPTAIIGQTKIPFFVSVDGDAFAGFRVTSAKFTVENVDLKIYYRPLELVIEDSIINIIEKFGKADFVTFSFNYELEENGKINYFHYDIQFRLSLINSRFIIISIYNTSSKCNIGKFASKNKYGYDVSSAELFFSQPRSRNKLKFVFKRFFVDIKDYFKGIKR